MTGAEISRALNAVWLLFLDRRGAIQLFDTSVEGFWRSFRAILLVAPLYAFSVIVDETAYQAHAAATGVSFDSGAFYLARAVTLVLDWVTLPTLLALLASFLGVRAGYPAFVVARNWGTVFAVGVYAMVAVVELTGLFEGTWILLPAGLALAVALRYSYLCARRALNVPIDVAVGFVVLDFLISLGLSDGIAYLFGVVG